MPGSLLLLMLLLGIETVRAVHPNRLGRIEVNRSYLSPQSPQAGTYRGCFPEIQLSVSL